MSTVVSLPEKRSDLGQETILEQPPDKRPKLDDPAMEVQGNNNSEDSKSGEEVIYADESSGDEDIFYCEVCDVIGHFWKDCPDKSKGSGLGCVFCYGPCKKKDDDTREHWSVEMVKQCVVCGNMGDHWADECPYWTEQPPTDDAMEVQGNNNSGEAKSGEEVIHADESSGNQEIFFCEICYAIGHFWKDCPDKSKGSGLGCIYCYGPCKEKDDDPREHWSFKLVNRCVVCELKGNHWADECPSLTEQPLTDDDEFDPF